MPTVVITETLADEAADWLGRHAELVWCPHDKPAELREALKSADAIVVRTYTQVDDALLDLAPNLKVVGRAGVGLDNIDLDACERRGVPVVYTPDANTQAVVEYVFGLILDELRPRTNLPDAVTPETFHALRKSEVGKQLDHLSLGILGFGRIGKRVGQVAHAIGIKLHVCDLLPEAQLRNAVDYPFEFCSHEDLYASSQIVTVHVDGRPSNRHLIGQAELDKLHDPCLLINTARGMLVDPAALAEWAKRRTTCRAVLDVHDPEPPSADYVLYRQPNVRLLPHLAARTNEALANMSWVVRDVHAVLEGKEPRFPAVVSS
ncbi:NAD(P)-dependent oxidoreductase [Phycisphaerales bacterium AB-hyl4]|uniref:NAD(P)-dependent oxidoreductase n=1 Tax=Natronomicrosphaera hydrolytica TaxID=3242702 RepID=A0ABV4UAR4_9BACT